MLTAERKRLLLDVLKMEGKIHASDLSKRLGVSEDTIKAQLRSLFAKLDVGDRTEAVMVGLRRGIITL